MIWWRLLAAFALGALVGGSVVAHFVWPALMDYVAIREVLKKNPR